MKFILLRTAEDASSLSVNAVPYIRLSFDVCEGLLKFVKSRLLIVKVEFSNIYPRFSPPSMEYRAFWGVSPSVSSVLLCIIKSVTLAIVGRLFDRVRELSMFRVLLFE